MLLSWETSACNAESRSGEEYVRRVCPRRKASPSCMQNDGRCHSRCMHVSSPLMQYQISPWRHLEQASSCTDSLYSSTKLAVMRCPYLHSLSLLILTSSLLIRTYTSTSGLCSHSPSLLDIRIHDLRERERERDPDIQRWFAAMY